MTNPAKAAPMREDVTQAHDIKRNPAAIWLSPICDDFTNQGDGRTWAEPAPDTTCEDCTEPWVRYVREDLAHTARPDAGDETWGPVTEWEMIDRLRDEEADSVTVLCDNPEGPPNNAVECCGFWTGFADRRFEGATIREALTAAVAAKDEAAKVGYPPMSVPDAGDEDVERVARAIGEATGTYALSRSPAWAYDAARAALAAMREGVDRGMVQVPHEPTEAMLKAAKDAGNDYAFGDHITWDEIPVMWRAMVKAAVALDTEQIR